MTLIVGIDLGTTNSEIAVIQGGVPVVLGQPGELILPSVVGLDQDGQLLVGKPARNQWLLAPDRTVRSVKRLMGQETTVRLGQDRYTPQEVSAIILRTLKARAETALGQPVGKAVITVPAWFNEGQRQATREAGELAGLEVVRIINEPTAAALTYEAQTGQRERLLVYDLGGGTFDVSIVQIEAGVVEVLASRGDTRLGGDDFDELLFNHVAQRLVEQHGFDPRSQPVASSRLLNAVEEAKKTLSTEPVAHLAESFLAEKEGVPLHLDVEVERHEYEELVLPLVERTLKSIDEALSDAGLAASEIDKVVLVGGMTRTPLVHRRLTELLGRPLHGEVEPDLCVAMGAAVQAGLIAGIDVGPVLVDITPHTLGIEILGELQGLLSTHVFSPVIERNTALPASRSELYSTCSDGQEKAEIRVFQGQDSDTRHNQHVGEFMLEGLADVEAGNQILVRFDLDLNGILKVTATERKTGRSHKLVVDSAMERFRQKGRAAAQDRLQAAFAQGDLAGLAAPATAQEERSGQWTEALAKAEVMRHTAEELLRKATPEDAADLKRSLEQLAAAQSEQDIAALQAVLADLEDLLFYLHDANV
jgi:molecular chaperone DnaK